MRRLLVKLLLASLTFTLGVTAQKLILANTPLMHVAASRTLALLIPTLLRPQPRLPPEKIDSPYEISSFIKENPKLDIQDLWQRLGIHDYTGPKHFEEGEFFTECYYCEVALFEYELDGEPGQEVILIISDILQESCRYLIFKPTNLTSGRWKLLGHIDHDYTRFRPLKDTCFSSSGKGWLVVQAPEVSGTGVWLEEARVFSVDPRGVKEVFTYPAEGHQADGPVYSPERNFTASIIGYEEHGGASSFEVEYTVAYSSCNRANKKMTLISRKQKAVYVRQSKSGRYKFDEAQSGLSRKEL